MEQEILKRIEAQDQKLEKIYQSVERLRRYFLWTLVITLVIVILPLIGLLVVIPQFLSTYTDVLGL